MFSLVAKLRSIMGNYSYFRIRPTVVSVRLFEVGYKLTFARDFVSNPE